MRSRRVILILGTMLVVLDLFCGFGSAASAPASHPMQRMLINTGCYRIAGHGTDAVPAYCLDEAGAAPGRGTMLGETPALGNATVSVGGKTMSLKSALALHLLRVEGTDTPDALSLVNTTNQPLSLCVNQPVVVMGNGVAYSGDLRKIYGQISDLMRLDRREPSDPQTVDQHDRLQQRLWRMVDDIDARQLDGPGPGTSVPDPSGCAAKSVATSEGGTTAILCR